MPTSNIKCADLLGTLPSSYVKDYFYTVKSQSFTQKTYYYYDISTDEISMRYCVKKNLDGVKLWGGGLLSTLEGLSPPKYAYNNIELFVNPRSDEYIAKM